MADKPLVCSETFWRLVTVAMLAVARIQWLPSFGGTSIKHCFRKENHVIDLFRLCDDFAHDSSRDVGQAEVAAGVAVG